MRGHFLVVLVSCLSSCGGRTAEQHASGAAPASTGSDAGISARPCSFQGFAPAVSYATANEPQSVVAIDRTDNGHLDLIVAERRDEVYSSELMTNQGNGTFAVSSLGNGNVGNLVAADFNGDGKLDLASQADACSSSILGPARARLRRSWSRLGRHKPTAPWPWVTSTTTVAPILHWRGPSYRIRHRAHRG